MLKRGVSLFSGSKKGMSPLIATVLLIAFAVAMGAMIMNWSSSLGESLSGPDCSGINLVLNPAICHTDNFIKVALINQGTDVDHITVKISDETTQNEINLMDSKLRRGDALDKNIPFVKSSSTYVGVVPAISQGNKIVSCPSPAIEISDVASCTI